MPRLTIREASASDLPAVLALYRAALEDEEILSPAAARRLFARMRSYPDYSLYVAREGRRVVGTFALLIMDNLGHAGTPSAIVEDVAVAPDRQGRGIGRRLMAFALARARRAGCYKLALSSNAKRRAAHRFYESLGFKRHGYSFVAHAGLHLI